MPADRPDNDLDNSTSFDAAAMRRWLDQFVADDFVATVAGRTGKDKDWCRWALETFTNEAFVFAPTAYRNLKPGARVLEVGSGIGFLTCWLHLNGIDIRGLDPASGPFDPFTEMSKAVAQRVGPNLPEVLEMSGQELDPAQHGEFDLIFSFNVLEHVESVADVFAAMANVLKPGGVMIHCCPNYSVPYEPHLGIPLIPFRPQVTDRVFKQAINLSRGIWDSLNFVTAGDIRRLARRHGLKLTFDTTLMYDRVQRLWSDETFAKRHFNSPVLRTALNVARGVGLIELLRYVPAGLSTPMLFRAEKLRKAT